MRKVTLSCTAVLEVLVDSSATVAPEDSYPSSRALEAALGRPIEGYKRARVVRLNNIRVADVEENR